MMPSTVLVSEDTQQDIDNLVASKTQSILLVGNKGSGTQEIAESLAARILGLTNSLELQKYPYYYPLSVEEGKRDIPISEIRRVVSAATLKIPSKRPGINRVVLIQNAEKMNVEAQNALLKDLEEPSDSTCYILTQSKGSYLLPTITSRCQKIIIKDPSKEHAVAHYAAIHEEKDILAAWSLAGGATQLMDELLKDDSHPLKIAAAQAKQFVQANKYERLLLVNKLPADKVSLGYFFASLEKVLTHLLKAATVQGQKEKILQVGNMSEVVANTKRMIDSSANVKLSLLWLVTNF